ncbi:FAD-binding protein [Aeromicrobium ginsengisoli]|uniref:FAD-binding protein n=1 Tax=Aeromicrobium ginsengisoli TaxID=363867 RepID=A0A5M4FJT8_9ACTN|nr:FAD-binding protein [Aeromicrobium ginsengisoli]KAA1400242.1 FAD-binding protein [Aeromicrobium ginsengisoli]
MTGTNWAGNLTYGASALLEPTSVGELCEIVAAAPRVRALGTRHSFNRIADTDGVQVSVAALPALLEVDAAARTVTVSAGLRYGELVEELDRAGWALHNLASLPHISVAGAIATGTHGSGDHNGSLASSVAGLELVAADGTVLTARRGDPDFAGMVVSLGRLGVVTTVTLDIVTTFQVRQDVYEGVSWDAIAANLDAITSSAYSVSMFTDWGEAGAGQAWLKSRADVTPPADFFGAAPATRELHPLPDESAEFTTRQLGVPGAWWDRLPHFRLGFTPSNGEELQTEYLVPRHHALAAIDAVRALAPAIRPHLFVSELRTIAADDLWLSPSHDVDCLAIHFTWRMHVPEVTALLPTLDDALASFTARPHWGKVFQSDRERLDAAYPRIADFRALADGLDPNGKFSNDQTAEWLGP